MKLQNVKKLIIEGIEIEVTKKKIKNMHLSVLPPNGKVRISAPFYIDDEKIKNFAISKIEWIKKHINKFENRPIKMEPIYISGESLYVWGRKYSLEVRQNNFDHVKTKDHTIILTVWDGSAGRHRENVMIEWYREQLKEKLPGVIKKWEDIIGVKTDSVRIKNMRTRWGTCNTKAKRIWINLQLAKMPTECLEYIVVHELVHLLEKSHNKVFKGYMDKFLPDWRVTKDLLNRFAMDEYWEE